KPTQEMKVFVGDVERYSWKVSTGKRGYDTPSGTYTARSMNEIWYSKQWDDAPMPTRFSSPEKDTPFMGPRKPRSWAGRLRMVVCGSHLRTPALCLRSLK
ncbi:MAG TPA: L,D-transpeptidase, partial [Bryobacteraceae bacterium]|nr:L,D-transpeptidase [Bryobacteraceae bacterium]